jgi:hypothetical protein
VSSTLQKAPAGVLSYRWNAGLSLAGVESIWTGSHLGFPAKRTEWPLVGDRFTGRWDR